MEDANRLVELDGVSLLGSKLRISSTSCYLARDDKLDLFGALSKELTMRRSDVKVHNSRSLISAKPTRILSLNNIVSFEDLNKDEDYMETLNDIKSECSQYGSLSNICVPRFGVYATKVFLEYGSVEDAVNAYKKLKNRTFDEKIVAVEYAYEEIIECLKPTMIP
jgi:hypothetical protein